MSLAKWKSNSSMLLRHLAETGVAAEDFDVVPSNLLKVLGVTWDPTNDRLRFVIPKRIRGLDPGEVITQRSVLSIVASIFDPLGYLSPYLVRGKLIIQRLWENSLQWNEAVPNELRVELMQWAAEFTDFTDLEIARKCASREERPEGYRLHVFGDASKRAYAAAAYLECVYADGPAQDSLLMAKSRLAPRSEQSLPRLELLASLMAVRLKNFLVQRLDIMFDSVRFYTDSTIAYHWATSSNPGSWKVFVHNRVAEVAQSSRREEWFHVDRKANVADLATRGVSARLLTSSKSWWNGPEWLQLPEERQPISRPGSAGAVHSADSVRHELRKLAAPVAVGRPLIDLERFSSAARAIRVLSLVLRSLDLVRNRETRSARELFHAAETQIIRHTQRLHFPKELAAVRAGEQVPTSSKLSALRIFIDDRNILRVRKRLAQATFLNYEKRNPIVLPGESRLARMLIVDTHRINAHFGVTTVLSQLRKRYWITRGRQVIRSILSPCVICKRRQGTPRGQLEAPLPIERAQFHAPFTTTGLDFCGHFYTRFREGDIKNGSYVIQKTYVAIFVCASTRAVHLEAIPALSAPQTNMALRRGLATYPGLFE
ncbi:uncharacterized protein LOC100906333 [Galendromus occidentalis]|uniref:Uncharacterized protein LOC100906333 n=1 Tax=Galendromus occidentalis TaxID=34638 RepID=A0AAJ6QL27_9ACAR|nr:uncharacterized protein LOC100906333 [Galendromus occidentalis]